MELRKIIMTNGGKVRYFTWINVSLCLKKSVVTHLICSTLCESKKEKYSNARFKIVRPEWIIDSIKEGKRLNESKYMYKNYSILMLNIGESFRNKNEFAAVHCTLYYVIYYELIKYPKLRD